MEENISRRGFDPLRYKFEDQVPTPGGLTEVADGVFWIQLPMWGRLNSINVWLLRDYDGWTIVDTGLNNTDVQKLWQSIFDNHLDGKPINRVKTWSKGKHPDFFDVIMGWSNSVNTAVTRRKPY